MKVPKFLPLSCFLYFFFSSNSWALQIQDSIQIFPKSELKYAHKIAKKQTRLRKRIQKLSKRKHNKSRMRDWLNSFFFSLGVVLLFLLGATVIGALMFYAQGTAQVAGRYLFWLFLGLLLLRLGIALVNDEGIGRMSWLTGGFLLIVFAVACPNEFEILLEILELLGG